MTGAQAPRAEQGAELGAAAQHLEQGRDDQTIRIWDATPLDGAPPLAEHCVTLPGHTHLVSGVACSRDGR